MDKEKLQQFLMDLNKLENKYEIYISSTYDEELNYDYEENPYVSGVSSQLVFSDKDGNEMTLNDLDI